MTQTEILAIANRHNIKGHSAWFVNDCYVDIVEKRIGCYMQDAFDDLRKANSHLTQLEVETFADEVCPKWRELL